MPTYRQVQRDRGILTGDGITGDVRVHSDVRISGGYGKLKALGERILLGRFLCTAGTPGAVAVLKTWSEWEDISEVIPSELPRKADKRTAARREVKYSLLNAADGSARPGSARLGVSGI